MAPQREGSQFRVGDKVSGKWPGSNMYYPAKVTAVRKDGQYELQFSDGSRHVLQSRHVESQSSGDAKRGPRSPRKTSRGRKNSQSRSRSRTGGSAGGTPGRAKRSPGRPKGSTTGAKRMAKTSPKTPTRASLRNIQNQLVHQLIQEVEKSRPEATLATTDTARIVERESPVAPLVPRSFLSIFTILVLTLVAPVVVLWVNLSCDREECSVCKLPKFPANVTDYINLQSVCLYLGWITFQAFLAWLPIGEEAEGQSLRDGSRLKYRLNGLHALAITMAVLMTLAYYEIPIDIIFENYIQLVITSIVVSYLISFLLLFRSSKLSKKRITEPDVARNSIYDFFIGRELNPRISDFDLKFFTMLRPGLIGWAVLNACMLWTEFQENGYYFNPNIWLVGVSQILYVVDAFVFEESILSTWDVTTEGLGFLLVFGNLTFVPFIFTLPVRYLLLYRAQMNWYILGAILLLNILGYVVYRGSNKLKDDFRRNPYDGKFRNSRTIPTKSARRILMDGLWAHLRHPNYLGDLMIALSWSLPCGFGHVIPYTYFVYLAVLLIHRAHRDHKMCERKYGNAWKIYCDQVRYKMIPPIY